MPRGVYTHQSRPAAERFWPKVNKSGPIPAHVPDLGPCWVWTGARLPDGRGTFEFNGRTRYAHVVAYILTTGHEPPPATPFITHLCDGLLIGCVRPDHLKPDTHLGNMAQMTERERSARGERHKAAKLTNAAVQEIRARYAAGGVSQLALASEYSVTGSAICLVIQGQRWRHIPGCRATTGNVPATAARGERHWRTTLTENQVRAIRTRYAAGGITQGALAAEYGVRQTTISEILRRRHWAHVE